MLIVKDLTQRYQQRQVLKDFSYSFTADQIHGIIGPNGAGKSTLLRLIAGVERPVSGRVIYQNRLLTHPIPEIGCVWQKPYLFQVTVFDNIEYGLRIRHWERELRQERVKELLQLFQLERLKDQWATYLSVGEAARVVIARAVAFHPKILLLDEPTANLDPGNTRLVEEILLQLVTKMSIILVTHDLFQTKRITGTTLFMENGELVECGPTKQVFNLPSSMRTARFINGEW